MRIALLRPACLLLIAAALTPAFPVQAASCPRLTLQTDSVLPARFVAVHGRRASLMGYTGHGLEAWAWPFQLFRDYHVSFVPQGTPRAISSLSILRRIEYRPDEIIRIYVGPDFEVREHLFVPLDHPGVILTYEVTGHPVDIRATFLPVLNLQWPGALGGQDLNWSPALHGYVISELTSGFRAIIASPQIAAAHTPVVNATLRHSLTQTIVLQPENGVAHLYAALEESSSAPGSILLPLEQQQSALQAAVDAHVAAVLAQGIQIQTPDTALNSALAWSRIALDQAWVSNPRIGSGIVAGYGPSRPERRPQYAWFFAGDGLIAAQALLAEGDLQRARNEFAFVLRYQNPSNGMIWHEISQSAGFIDWAHKYPYMYVHVDITYQFLSALADYYSATGDLAFLQDHWPQIQRAWYYGQSLIDAKTGLPQIPAGKEGGNEQDRMTEDVGLSASWISAATAYSRLARATRHTADAAQAFQSAEVARHAFTARYWDSKHQFWIAGYSASGSPLTDERSHPGLLGENLFTPAQENAALDRLASSAFQTDWGTRSMSALSPSFDPGSYASGSVSALATDDMAEAFWRDHRPAVASAIWQSLLPWFQLDSLGRIHEVLAGDVFHPQIESVPEQTWSSAGFLSSAIHGLFGIEVHAPRHRLVLAPHLDPRWPQVSLRNIAVGDATVSAILNQNPDPRSGEAGATFTATQPVHLTFTPQIPLGATAVHATLNGRSITATIQRHDEEEQASVNLDLSASAPAHVHILWTGGVRVLAPAPNPTIGARSRQLKLISVRLEAHTLTLTADVLDPAHSSIDIETPWNIGSIEGGAVAPQKPGWYRLSFAAPAQSPDSVIRRQITLHFSLPSQ